MDAGAVGVFRRNEMALKIEGTVEYGLNTYESAGELRPPKRGEKVLNSDGTVISVLSDYPDDEPRFILREVKPPHQYKVGDWVRVIESRYGIPVGTETQIELIDANGHYWLSGKLTLTVYPNGTCWAGNEFEPCDPPAPKYRPFANAAEFLPHANRILKYTKNERNHHIRVDAFNDKDWFMSGSEQDQDYQYMLDYYVFADDGSPCGVLVTE